MTPRNLRLGRFFAALPLVGFVSLASCVMSPQDSSALRAPSPTTTAEHPERGLLANPILDRQPMKAVYFFAGERGTNADLYTTHPSDTRDGRWNSDPSTRGWVMDRMARAHVNTVVMSYWSTMPRSSPMALDDTSLSGVLDGVTGRPLVVLPAIESANGWAFADEFPTNANGEVAPGLVDRVGNLVALFHDRMSLWAQMYDSDGTARYAVNIIHASSNRLAQSAGATDDEAFARGFDLVAAQVEQRFGIRVGFTLDAVAGQPYSATPSESGTALEQTASVLAIQGFEPEVWSGVVKSAPPCPANVTCAPYDNNVTNLGPIAKWKRKTTFDWVKTGVPVILGVSNGMDGRFVWAKYGVGIWGDNLNYTDDRFRNLVSEMKGKGVKGITFDTWNGYTEGYAAVPSAEHGDTVYAWLTDLFTPDPRNCSHEQFVDGVASHRVYGQICKKWIKLGGDQGFGPPATEQLRIEHGRVSHFVGGGSIYWSHDTGAHEVHGIIGETYRSEGGGGSCLGLPISDEEADGDGRISVFEHGVITWHDGLDRGTVSCHTG